MNYLTKLLNDYYKRNRLTQTELAKKLNILQPFLSRMLNGVNIVTYKTLKKLDIKINIDMLKSYLIDEIMQQNNIEKLCDCYNKIYEDKKDE